MHKKLRDCETARGETVSASDIGLSSSIEAARAQIPMWSENVLSFSDLNIGDAPDSEFLQNYF